ncbi:MAG: VanW family protein [Burkholderiaceae bacterium]
MPNARSPALTWKLPTRLDAAGLRLRVWAHVTLRALRDLRTTRVARHGPASRLADAPVVAEHRSPLWLDGRTDEFLLVAGKVENLRIARSAFDGVVVPAGTVFSFWKQLGRPTRGRGFVEGREIRTGCVVPVIAGGLCQLSNALATCAAQAGMTLVERHAHTARIEQGPPVDGHVDATVSWNYVDLRIAAPFDWRLEVEMSGDELIVRVRAQRAPAPARPARAFALLAQKTTTPPARGCLTCDETRCYRHLGTRPAATTGTTAVLVDAWTPEFAAWLRDHAGTAAWFTPWLRRARRVAGAWTPAPASTHTVARLASWWRTWLLRRHAGEGGRRQAALLRGQQAIARSFARGLEPGHTHLVVDQGLLVPLALLGVLHGRTYDVLMRALPADELQHRLDGAARRWPDAASLRDFRVDASHAATELRALRGARRMVTPHAEVARHLQTLAPGRVDLVAWAMPMPMRHVEHAMRHSPSTPPLVAFPASALARKGACELAAALRLLGWRLLVLGTPSSDADLWHGIAVEHAGYRDATWLNRADVVALPAHVEHSPRALLLALAHGLPVVATPACGLPASDLVHPVEPGDVGALIDALVAAHASRRRPEEILTAS